MTNTTPGSHGEPQWQYGGPPSYRTEPFPQQYPYAHGPYYPQSPYGPAYPPAAPPQPKRSGGAKVLLGVGGGLVAAALVIGGVVAANSGGGSVLGNGSAVLSPGGSSSSGSGSGSTSNSGQAAVTSGVASATQQKGIVVINSVLKYQSAESAGTGMILSSNGEILTNNHVIDGATSIRVTVETTGKTYRADVVGTSPTQDVAVLKLRGASGLQTAKLADNADDVQVGDTVIGVGNARGTGTLTAAGGKVTALDQSITASSESGANPEQLHELIQTDAPIVSGDSGGPLYDSDGDIVGINTAASSQQQQRAAQQSEAYAIPIDNALAVAKQIESGQETTSVHIGLPGFLGITTVQAQGGVGVQDVVRGLPADDAGIEPGSVITAVDGTAVTSPTALHTQLSGKNPGDKVSISWTDTTGQSHTATISLAQGPAD